MFAKKKKGSFVPLERKKLMGIFSRIQKEYKQKELWKFTGIAIIEEAIFNPLLETFLKYGLNGLVRENIQNALDAALDNVTEPVEVKIEIGKMMAKDVPGIEQIEKRIECLTGGNKYMLDAIEHMKTAVKKTEIDYISFEDSNTKGLTDETWESYAYKKGEHCTEKDEMAENIRGGSHGVGKIASNAASELNMMFFSNCDANGKKQIGGTVQLAEHEFQGKTYRATGYFTDQDERGEFSPYQNDGMLIKSEVFRKDTRGLKIVIPYLRETYNDPVEVIRAVCDNFFVAVLQNRLKVFVNEVLIDRETIRSILEDKEIYREEDSGKKNFTGWYIKTFLEKEPVDIEVLDKKKEKYHFSLYFQYDEKIQRGRAAIVRTIGMKIQDFAVKGHSKTPFNAVLIPMSVKEDVFLKSLENESHTELTVENIRDEEIQKNAKRFINNLTKRFVEYIADYLKQANPTDGGINTEDLFYSVENKFRKQLEDYTGTVEITPRGKKTKRLTVKKDINKKREEPSKGREKTSENPTSKSRKRKKRGEDGEKGIYSYPLKPNHVKRVVIDNEEQVFMDLSQYSEYRGETICNLHVKLIDGQGKAGEEKIKLSSYYTKIADHKTCQNLSMDGDRIFSVPIHDGKIFLDSKMNQNVNHALKFMYIVEVEI